MPATTIVVDACLVITFGNARSLDVIGALQRHRVAVARWVVDEVARPPAKDELQRQISAGHIVIVAIDPEETYRTDRTRPIRRSC